MGVGERFANTGQDVIGHTFTGLALTAYADDADAALLAADFLEAFHRAIGPTRQALANVRYPVLGEGPPFELRGSPDIDNRIALDRKYRHRLFAIAADLRDVADVGGARIPFRRDPANDQGVETAAFDLGTNVGPAAVALGNRQGDNPGFRHHFPFNLFRCRPSERGHLALLRVGINSIRATPPLRRRSRHRRDRPRAPHRLAGILHCRP